MTSQGDGREARGREIVEALFVDLRQRKFLEYLFNEDPNDCGAYGYIDSPLDLWVQDEIRTEWTKIIATRTPSVTAREEGLAKSLDGLRESLRVLMLEQPISGTRSTYSDGFGQALAHAIWEIDRIHNPSLPNDAEDRGG